LSEVNGLFECSGVRLGIHFSVFQELETLEETWTNEARDLGHLVSQLKQENARLASALANQPSTAGEPGLPTLFPLTLFISFLFFIPTKFMSD
jgi:hypothetical protein